MGSAFCIKCKCKQVLKDTYTKRASNGAPFEFGFCTVCGSKTSRILSRVEREAMKEKTVEEGKTSDAPKQT